MVLAEKQFSSGETATCAAPQTLEILAETRGSDVGIVDGDIHLTYKDWNDQANALAEVMARSGVNADSVVVTRTQIRHEWAIIDAACAKLGSSVLGLNWRLTPTEVHFILSNSGADAFFCDDTDPAPLLPVLQSLPMKLIVSIDAEAEGFRSWEKILSGPAPLRYAEREAPLIIYTSGTTGLPKGVRMGKPAPHATAEQLMEYYQSIASVRPSWPTDVIFVTLPLHHGSGSVMVHRGVQAGRKLVMMRRYDPEGALALIEKHGITTWTAVPTMFKRMTSLPDEVIAKYDTSSLHSLGVGAAPVTPEMKQWIIARFGEILQEGYGATEPGLMSAITPEQQKVRPESCGRPYKHVYFEIRDFDGSPLPIGSEGEIWVKTPVTLTNYVNAPLLDNETLDDRGYYRTGDVGRLDDEGFLYITDRVKDMIISGGVNIYPAEIEAAIARHPTVLDVAVIGIPDDEFGEQVKAFVELKPGHSVEEAELRDFVAPLLATYKRPKSIEFMEELPRNTVGKLLKRELRAPYWENRNRKV